MRETLTTVFLWAAALTSGTLFGGAFYEQLVIQPMWAAAPPESFEFMTNARFPVIRGLAPFYAVMTPAMLLAAVGSAIASWRTTRKPMALMVAAGAVAIVAFTFTFFIPKLAVFFGPNGEGYAGGHEPREMATMARQWVQWNWVRLALVLGTFAASIVALTNTREAR